ncbi:S49 family peptidase [Halorhabdus sp. CUG00001]|uniref:S49 family peptidase n=1 Tax=Halorhabdus sp. CUG00001 TaxID=2600297 RepID=UPI00131B8126|nr:S49 family peptidase [Halorhabdus sp. CUG00001]
MVVGPDSSRRNRLVLVAILAIGAGVILTPQVYSAVTGPDGTVAVVELSGTIDEPTAQFVEAQLRDARHNDSIKGVVLDVESGGGLPGQSERIYAAVERTSERMPVIATVDTLGASGAYLSMVPADEIYVAPSAQAIGSVGVTGAAPRPLSPSAGDTGPNKGGLHPDEAREDREVLAELFVESVLTQRGDEIELNRTEISRAKIYLGTEAVDNGFADKLGFVDDAIADVADRAGLDTYAVETHEMEQQGSLLGSLPIGDADSDAVVTVRTDDGLDRQLVLAVAPQFLDRAVGDDVEIVSHSGTTATADERRRPAGERASDTGGDAE